MIQWLQQKYNLASSDLSLKAELESIRKQVQDYRKKYNKEDKEMEVSSESDSEVDEEEQKKIDEEMRKRQQKKKGMRTSVSAEVYGIHNIKKPYVPRVIPKTDEQKDKLKSKGIKRVISALDNDECGRKGTQFLKTVFDVTRFQYIKGVKDPGEMTKDIFNKCYRKTMQKFRKGE